MKSNTGRFITMVAICLGLMISLNMPCADAQTLKELSAEWWQWAVSIPTSANPLTDTTGTDCLVGQRGATWFLAGVLGTPPGGTVTRTCSIPQGRMLFFPIINAVSINTPNVCGSINESAAQLRADIAPIIDGASKLSLTVDNKEVKILLQRVKSTVFAVALPEDNVFNAVCGGPGSVPAGIYSPAWLMDSMWIYRR